MFINDRSARGDPIAYAVTKSKYKQWGGWKQVTAAKVDTERTTFFQDDANKPNLFSPKSDEDTESKDTPHAMIAGPKVALYVLKERPSAGTFEQWANNELEGTARDKTVAWAELASQTTLDNQNERPSSILAHDLEAIIHPSEELKKRLQEHLDKVLGKAPVVPQCLVFSV